MPSPFPLLRLPRLVLFDVFKSLRIDEKIKLSLCSKKISTQINNARLYSQKVIMCLDLGHEIRVYSENYNDSFEISICPDSWKRYNSNAQQFSMASCTVSAIFVSIGVKTFWKNLQEGCLSVIRHLLNMFQCKISSNISYYNSDLYQPTILMLFDLQVEFKTLTIQINGSEDENLLNQIFSNFKLIEDLIISHRCLSDFTPVFTSWPQKITITNSAWFTLEHLLACTCTRITLGWSPLENTDLDVILRKWKAGGFPNLEYLWVNKYYISNDRMTILTLNPLEVRGNVIQTDDGSKKATFKRYPHCIEMCVTPF
ncbi:hypothetical protein CRE_21994 [Caenorhabditis remanei]|uniref:F-box domain-containing protein n=1 Tax=Caenorhabditis remanei TaxID=31234 RepID=E3N3I5_CAERE|nr:hypothetical protein CRE_21994 [Caenorhabditis remanei]